MKLVGERRVWSVAEVAGAIFRRIEDVPSVWIEAEVTNLSRRGSQVYLTLVDYAGGQPHQIDASINAVVFDRLPAKPDDGTQVQAYGRVEMWVPRSQLRFRVERLELAGDGLLLARIDALRRRLDAEGLTADARKRPLPFLPRRIGLITSGEGAARHDFLTNLQVRFPGASVVVVSSLVQGDAAPTELVRALRYLDAQADIDVIVLARGGGALEDLMAFNSEVVCRAVAGSGTPVVSAVGHESDVTVCDLVADVRVSTPTKAAEAVVPDLASLSTRLDGAGRGLARALSVAADRRLRSVQTLSTRLVSALRVRGRIADTELGSIGGRLRSALGRAAVGAGEKLVGLEQALTRAIRDDLERRAASVERLAGLHDVLSPARTVARGYAIVRTVADGRVASRTTGLTAGTGLDIELADGRVQADVVDRSAGSG